MKRHLPNTMEPSLSGDRIERACSPYRFRRLSPAWFVLLTVVGWLVHAAPPAPLQLYVSPTGKDTWSGRFQEPQPDGHDGPLASLAGARDSIRRWRAERHQGPVTVLFAPGRYFFSEPVPLEEQDSGRPGEPVTYRAAVKGAVHFTAGIQIGGWEPVRDPAVLRLWPEITRRHAVVADLKAQGITDFGRISVRGFALPAPVAEAELFYDEEPMELARWPNEGFRGLRRVLDLTRLEPDTDRASRWLQEADPWIMAYWRYDWAELYKPLAGIETEGSILQRSPEIRPRYGIQADAARWYGFNLLSEIDRPGEYYLDRERGRLYFWPPHPEGRTVLSVGEGFLRAKNLRHVTFEGFVFEACRGRAILIEGGEECRLVGCTIRNTGLEAVRVAGGRRHEVYGCDVYGTGAGGIQMTGGDRPTLTPARHNAENNHVHHYARRVRTYRTAITVAGVGNRIAHNLIHHGPHMALSAPGNDHLIEYNEIHNVVAESGDAGAYYVGRDWTQRGNILRYNYWHDIAGGTGYGGMTIYLDDQHCGHTIDGNLFVRCSQAVSSAVATITKSPTTSSLIAGKRSTSTTVGWDGKSRRPTTAMALSGRGSAPCPIKVPSGRNATLPCPGSWRTSPISPSGTSSRGISVAAADGTISTVPSVAGRRSTTIWCLTRTRRGFD